MRIYNDDGLDDDDPYDYSQIDHNEAKETIAKMELRNHHATETEIIDLIKSLIPKYKEYYAIYRKSDKYKLSSFGGKILEQEFIINDSKKYFIKNVIILEAIRDAKWALEEHRDFELKIDDLEREYNKIPFTDPEKANSLKYYDVFPGFSYNIPHLEYLSLYIKYAPHVNHRSPQSIKQSKAYLDKLKKESYIKLDKVKQEIAQAYESINKIKAEEKRIKQSPNLDEAQILHESSILLTEIDKNLNSRLTIYLNYAPDSNLKRHLKRLLAYNNNIGCSLKQNYIKILFKAIFNNGIKLETPHQGD